MSRRSRSAVLVLCLILSSIFVWFDRSFVSEKFRPAQSSAEQVKSGDFEKYNEKTFYVVKVVDGDTLDIDIPDGKHKSTRIRLIGIDTPETKSPNTGVMYFGPEATEYAKTKALGNPVKIYLDTISDTRDKYNRLLAYIQLPDGTYLNEILISEGYAYAYLQFRHSFYYKYTQLEVAARRNKKGLWKEVTREQLPKWLQKEKPKLLTK